MQRHPLYPLRFEPIYKQKVWGGRRLEQLGRDLPGDSDTLIGESWELADLGQTSASGGGGGEERSIIADGPLAGMSIHDAMMHYGKSLIGALPLTDTQEFPLLVKFLDAGDNLSVQVHPDEQYAAEHEDAFVKNEAWYVVATEPGAAIYKGVKEGVTPQQFREAIDHDAVEELLIRVPVEPGQCHYLPSGTCHALGAGVLVAEVQTPSDTTFRVYDWGRTGRELHVEQAMQCIHFGPADVRTHELGTRVEGASATVTRLVRCPYFRIDRVEAAAGYSAGLGDPGAPGPIVWMILEGEGEMTCEDGPTLPFGQGQTWLLPPGMVDGRVRFDAPGKWLEVTFPQAGPTLLA